MPELKEPRPRFGADIVQVRLCVTKVNASLVAMLKKDRTLWLNSPPQEIVDIAALRRIDG